jgi:hypothetical protein
VVVELVSQIGLNAATTAVEEFAHSIARNSTEEGNHQQQKHGYLYFTEATTAAKCVDALLKEPGAEGCKEVRSYDESQANEIGPAVRFEVGK